MTKISKHQPTDDAENGHTKHTEGNGNKTTTGAVVEKKMTTPMDGEFVKRVTSLPLVQDGVSTAQAIANKTSLGRFALSKANSTYQTLYEYASRNEPIQTYYQAYFEPHLQKVDQFGCRSLDVIESRVPLIAKPSQDIYQSMTEPTYQLFGNAKIRLDSTISNVTHPAHLVIEQTNKRLSPYVDNLENVVERYLPINENNVVKKRQQEDQDEAKERDPNQLVRVYDVLNSASRRVTQRVTEQVNKSGIPKSRQEFTRLVEENSTIQNLTSQISLYQEAITHSVTVYGSLAKEKLPASVSVRVQQTSELLNQVAELMNQQLIQIKLYIKSTTPQPEWVKEKLQSLAQTTMEQLESIKQELVRNDIGYVDKLKHVALNLQEQLLPMLQQMANQLTSYSNVVREKAVHELNVPSHYFGINSKTKTQ
ncbi:hypothetical protein BD770DRAFT_432586 [Pilaira anomala]|nr:hypothetical protein BD770DRAFT_432586 [Pilaira anomala]